MNAICPTKYKKEQADGQNRKIVPVWSMAKGLKNERLQFSEIKPPSPYPPNRRKSGVTLPIAGRLPYKVMLNEECPDLEKKPVKSIKEVEPSAKKGKGKGKKGKKK